MVFYILSINKITNIQVIADAVGFSFQTKK
jgi:hypothetical protein